MNPEGAKTEGAFYLWTAAEVNAVLGDGAALLRTSTTSSLRAMQTSAA